MKYTREMKREIAQMYATGKKARTIAKDLGMKLSAVKFILCEARKNDEKLRHTHITNNPTSEAYDWFHRQTPQFRRDAKKWLDVLTVEEMYDCCVPKLSASMFEDAHDC